MLLIPFEYEIPEGQQIRGMDSPEFWLSHGEMPAIFNWFLDGYRRLILTETFSRSLRMEAAIEELRDDCDHARYFARTFFAVAENGRTKCDDAYQEYRAMCERFGYKPLGNREFGKTMFRCYPHLRRARLRDDGTRNYWYEGIIRSNAERPWEAKSGASFRFE